MARQVLPLAGAIIGGIYGGPQGAQIGFTIGSIVGNEIDPQVIRAPGIKDIPTQEAGEGGFRQVVYGTSWVNSTNLIDFEREPRIVTQRQRQGKGGGPIVETKRILRTFAVGLGEPISAIRMIRIDGKIVYDIRPGSAMLAESAEFAKRYRFHDGSEDQLPDPDLEVLPHNGVGNTPYYRGTSYMVFPDFDLTDRQGRIPTIEVEGVQAADAAIEGQWWLVATGSAHQGKLWLADNVADMSSATLITRTPHADKVDTGVGGGGYFRLNDSTAVLVTSDGEVERVEGLDITDPMVPILTEPFPDGGYRVRVLVGMVFVFNSVGSSSTYYCSTDGGATWNTRTAPAHRCWDIGRVDSRWVMLCAQGSDRRFYYSDDPGEPLDWTAGEVPSSHDAGTVMMSLIDRALTLNNGDVLLTRDGADWTRLVGVVPDNIVGGCYATDGVTIVVGDTNASVLCRSDDGGETWTEIPLEGVRRIDYHQGTWVASGAGDDGGVFVSTDRGLTWNEAVLPAGVTPSLTNHLYVTPIVAQSTIDSTTVELADVVADVADRCGLAAAQLDLEEIDEVVAGVTLGGEYSGGSAISTLRKGYFFDLVDLDKKLVAVKRGGAVKATVASTRMVEEPDENVLRGQDIEYPRQLLLRYLNPGQNYAAPAAPARRTSPDVRVRGEVSEQLPIAMDETTALRTADKMLKVLWEDQNGEVIFSLPARPYAWLTPTDCLTLQLRTSAYRVRVDRVEESAGVLKVTARRDRQSAYTSSLVAEPLEPPTRPPPSLPGETTFVVMNLPALVDDHDRLGVYVAVAGDRGSAWRGAAMEASVDGGATWETLTTIVRRSVMGQLLATLPAADPAYTDSTNPLRVELVEDDELENLTDEQFLNEANAAAIVYGDGTAEIVQFKTATDDGDREWTLTTLQRGRLNTEAGAHNAGATFVMLETATFVPLPSALRGRRLRLRFSSLGTSPEVAPIGVLDWDPVVIQTEFPAAFLDLDRAGGVISGSWSPRGRFGTSANPAQSDNFDGWRVTLDDGATTETFTVIDPDFSRSDAAFVGDVEVTVEQLNRWTGAGPAITETI